MKKLGIFLIILLFTGGLFAQSVGVGVERRSDLDISFSDFPAIDELDFVNSPFTIEQDPYAEVPTFYIVGGSAVDDYRYLLRLTDPVGEDPFLELVTEVPIYLGDAPDYDSEIAMWGQWVYLTGLAVSEDYIYLGARTFAEPEGVYVARYTKDGQIDQVRANDVVAHRVRGLHYVELDEPVTFYVDEDGNFAHEPGEGITEYQADNALLGASGRAIYAFNPDDIDYGDPAAGLNDRNFRPCFWAQTVRRTSRDFVYDNETSDLYIFATGTSDAIDGEDMHDQWAQVYPEGWPSFDSPGIVRQVNYNPLIRPADDVDVPRGQGTATEQIISLPVHPDAGDQNSAGWAGIDLVTSEAGDKFLVAVDNWNQHFYIYNIQYQQDGSVIPYQVYAEGRGYSDRPMNPAMYEHEEGIMYLLLTNNWTNTIEVYEIEFAPTFSSSWSLFN